MTGPAKPTRRGINCKDCLRLNFMNSVPMFTMNCSGDNRLCHPPGDHLDLISPLSFRPETIFTKSATKRDKNWPRSSIRDSGIWRRMCSASWNAGSLNLRRENRAGRVLLPVSGHVRPTDTGHPMDTLYHRGRSHGDLQVAWDEVIHPEGLQVAP